MPYRNTPTRANRVGFCRNPMTRGHVDRKIALIQSGEGSVQDLLTEYEHKLDWCKKTPGQISPEALWDLLKTAVPYLADPSTVPYPSPVETPYRKHPTIHNQRGFCSHPMTRAHVLKRLKELKGVPGGRQVLQEEYDAKQDWCKNIPGQMSPVAFDRLTEAYYALFSNKDRPYVDKWLSATRRQSKAVRHLSKTSPLEDDFERMTTMKAYGGKTRRRRRKISP